MSSVYVIITRFVFFFDLFFYLGYSSCILKPKTTEQVSKILEFCNNNRLAVCPQGGNTGLVGGSVPVFDEIVLSTALMTDIISIDDISGKFVILNTYNRLLKCM